VVPVAESRHLYFTATSELPRAVAWLAEVNAQHQAPHQLLMAGLFLKAVACSLREIPHLNGYWIDGSSQTSTAVHLGVGVARRRRRPVIPVLLDADRRDLDDLCRP
jgi:pyruvate dehydrogenase E2 component (dihydrolipoamide acetyltransferase)